MTAPPSARILLLAGTAVRLAIGAGYLLAPSKMAAAQLAPQTDDEPDARLFVRGFGGHQVVTAAITLAALPAERLRGPALALNALIDGIDIGSAALELSERRSADRALLGGILVSGAGIVWAAAVQALD